MGNLRKGNLLKLILGNLPSVIEQKFNISAVIISQQCTNSIILYHTAELWLCMSGKCNNKAAIQLSICSVMTFYSVHEVK